MAWGAIVCSLLVFLGILALIDPSVTFLRTGRPRTPDRDKEATAPVSTGQFHDTGSRDRSARSGIGFGFRASSAGGKHLDLAKIAGFVEDNWDDAPTLAAVYSLNPDERIAGRLDEMSEESPIAAASLALMSGQSEIQRDYAMRLIKLAPNDALGYIIAAESNFRAGDSEAGELLLSQTAGLDQLDGFRDQILEAQDQAWKAEGSDEIERGLILTGDAWTKKLHGIVGGLALRAVEGGDPEQLARKASVALNLIDMLKHSSSRSLNIERSLISLESVVLQNLPADFQIDGQTSSRRLLEQLSQREAEMNKSGSEAYELLDRSSPELCREYFRVSRKSGELDAVEWLAGRNPNP